MGLIIRVSPGKDSGDLPSETRRKQHVKSMQDGFGPTAGMRRPCKCVKCGNGFWADWFATVCEACMDQIDARLAEFGEKSNGDLPPDIDRCTSAIKPVERMEYRPKLLGE